MIWKEGDIAWTGKNMLALIVIKRVNVIPDHWEGAPCVCGMLLHDFRERTAGGLGYYVANELVKPVGRPEQRHYDVLTRDMWGFGLLGQ